MSGAMQAILPILGATGGAAAGSMLGPYGSMAGMGLGAAGGSALGGMGSGPAQGGGSGLANPVSLANTGMGMSGQPAFVTPGTQGTPDMPTINNALAQNPSTAGLQGQVAGVDPPMDGSAGGIGSPTMGGGSNAAAWAGVGPMGAMYFDYLNQRRLAQLQQRTAYAPEHSTPMTSGLPPLSLYPSESFAVPQL